MWSLLSELFAELLSLDGKHVRTVAALVRPGRLTELYLAGKRASYIRPVRLYIVASLLFFLTVGVPTPDAESFNVYLDQELLGRAEHDPALGNIQLMSFSDGSWLGEQLAPLVEPKLEELGQRPVQQLVDDYFKGLERLIPTALIFFVPFLGLAIKLLYIRRPFFYVEHLVFALHFQSALFFLLVLAKFANLAGLSRLYPGLITYIIAFFLVGSVYMLFALRRVYRQSWLKSGLKAAALGLLYLVLMQPVLLVTIMLVVRTL